jgi:hypothetical protein
LFEHQTVRSSRVHCTWLFVFALDFGQKGSGLLLLDRVVKKGRFVPVHAMKAYRGSRCLALLILNLGARWRRVVDITPQLLYSPERTPVPIE